MSKRAKHKSTRRWSDPTADLPMDIRLQIFDAALAADDVPLALAIAISLLELAAWLDALDGPEGWPHPMTWRRQ